MALPAEQLSLPLGLESGEDHFAHLHACAHGTTLLWERAAANRWLKLQPGDPRVPELLAAQAGQLDRYISTNEFHGWRYVRLLKSLRCCYVDIDNCRDPEYALEEALDTLKAAQLPCPSAVVFSGRGLHLYWFIEPVPARALPVWQRCQDTLIAALRGVGADPVAKDCTRVLRLVGSVNSKTGTEVRGVVFDPEPYGFHHLCDEILGYRTQPGRPAAAVVRDLATARAQRGERLRTGSIYDRWHLAYRDLLTIAQHHKRVPVGSRDSWLFLSAVALSWFANAHTLRDELTHQARIWTPGLSDDEVAAALKQPLERAAAAGALKADYDFIPTELEPRYKFKRETLFAWMADLITPDLAPRLRAIVSDDTKAQHEREREAQRDRVAEGRHESHQRGRKSVGEPWQALGISRATYYRRKAAGTL